MVLDSEPFNYNPILSYGTRQIMRITFETLDHCEGPIYMKLIDNFVNGCICFMINLYNLRFLYE